MIPFIIIILSTTAVQLPFIVIAMHQTHLFQIKLLLCIIVNKYSFIYIDKVC